MGKENKSRQAKLLGVSRQLLYYRHKKPPKDWQLKIKIEENEILELNLSNRIAKSLEEDDIVLDKSQEKFSNGIESIFLQSEGDLVEIK